MIKSNSALGRAQSGGTSLRGEPVETAQPSSTAWLTPPIGTRDVLPPEASERRTLSRGLLSVYAEHGYALPDRDIFDKKAAERDWELIFAMFHRQIPPYAP